MTVLGPEWSGSSLRDTDRHAPPQTPAERRSCSRRDKHRATTDGTRAAKKGATGVRLVSRAPNAGHRETAVELVCYWIDDLKCQLRVYSSHTCGSKISIAAAWEIAMRLLDLRLRKQALGEPCHRRNPVALLTSHISGLRVQTTTGNRHPCRAT